MQFNYETNPTYSIINIHTLSDQIKVAELPSDSERNSTSSVGLELNNGFTICSPVGLVKDWQRRIGSHSKILQDENHSVPLNTYLQLLGTIVKAIKLLHNTVRAIYL